MYLKCVQPNIHSSSFLDAQSNSERRMNSPKTGENLVSLFKSDYQTVCFIIMFKYTYFGIYNSQVKLFNNHKMSEFL